MDFSLREGVDRNEFQEFIDNSGLNEEFDWDGLKYLVVAKEHNKLFGLVAYGLLEIEGKAYPRFLHIIITPEKRKTRRGILLMLKSEEYMRKLGYRQTIAYIMDSLKDRDMNERYAMKFGYKYYTKNNEGKYFYKDLGGL